jgi:uncharacterized membrane protein YgaE (UPF0421/DUF939 family)
MAQVLAWLAAAGLWIAFTCILWLARGRKPRPEPVREIPGDISPRKLTRPVVLFALVRALAVAVAVGIAFGLHLPNADWMAIATLVAMKPSLEQSALVAEQRVAGAILGALVAAVFLLTIDNKHALELIVLVLAAAAAALRTVNYAIYCAAIAALVLVADDIPHPTNLDDEVRRVLFTLAGVGIAALVMWLANQPQKRASKTAPPAAGTSTGVSTPA